MRNTNSGDQQNGIFGELLNKFDKCESKKDWNGLIEETKTRDVNFRQRQAIIARCENSLNGTHGNTKTDLQLNAGKIK